MSRFYKDLHDRELLSQTTAALNELMARNLIDVVLPESRDDSESAFPRRLASVTVQNGRLALQVERELFGVETHTASA